MQHKNSLWVTTSLFIIVLTSLLYILKLPNTLHSQSCICIKLITVTSYLLVSGTLTLTLILKLSLHLIPKPTVILTLTLILRLTLPLPLRNTNPKPQLFINLGPRWLGSQVVSMLHSGTEGPRFKSQSRHCRVTVLGNCSHPLCLCSPSSEIGSSPLKG